jgi:phosphate/sulfate permease
VEIHLFTVVALLFLAIAGISVGVSNDAVNFLNSSLGSKVAPEKIILLIASIGIIIGVTFSSGMMEVARKGIFNPEHFVLEELLIIFFAVMVQNILLLDLFNTFGLPTSTTVSMVFGLFGGALAISILKTWSAGESFDTIIEYLNTGKLLAIIAGIFLSVIFAFIFGSIIQWISRLIFTFDFKNKIQKYGAIWGGLALTLITYFILVKGAEGASFITEYTIEWIKSHTWQLMLYSFIGLTIILQLLMLFFKINVLKIIVLAGTFSIAMAFAANDLVNFIGAPLAGLNSYKIASGFENPESMTMEALSQPFKANTWILLLSGIIMVVTLYLSKKSRTVSRTEISLGRQDEGYERFESMMVSRLIVRLFINTFNIIKKIIPVSIQKKVNQRFDISKYKPEKDEKGETPSFDLLRASINLVVAAALISYGTSLKLPLSTTYVTFIVAMATALPDRAWGRESAVYRISGVLTVVGGWFFTAIIAAIIAMIIATIIFFGKVYTIIAFLILSAFIIYRSTALYKKREKEQQELEKTYITERSTFEQTIELLFENIGKYFKDISSVLSLSFQGVYNADLKTLNKARKQAKKLSKKSDSLVSDVLKSVKFANEKNLESGHTYAKALGALHEMASRLSYITKQSHDYFDNNHQKFNNLHIDELKQVNKEFKKIMKGISDAFTEKNLNNIKKINLSAKEFNSIIKKFDKNQLKRIQKSGSSKKRSMLFLNILDDTQGIIYNLLKVSKAFKDFYENEKNL